MRESPAEVPAIQHAVERLRQCQATFRETVSVVEQFEGKTVGEGEVSIFDLTGHPRLRCLMLGHPQSKAQKNRSSMPCCISRQ